MANTTFLMAVGVEEGSAPIMPDVLIVLAGVCMVLIIGSDATTNCSRNRLCTNLHFTLPGNGGLLWSCGYLPFGRPKDFDLISRMWLVIILQRIGDRQFRWDALVYDVPAKVVLDLGNEPQILVFCRIDVPLPDSGQEVAFGELVRDDTR